MSTADDTAGRPAHELKCWPEFFEGLESGEKTFELRKNDRDYRVGDTLIIRCWDPRAKYWIQREPLRFRVTYVLASAEHLAPGYVALGLARLGHASGPAERPAGDEELRFVESCGATVEFAPSRVVRGRGWRVTSDEQRVGFGPTLHDALVACGYAPALASPPPCPLCGDAMTHTWGCKLCGETTIDAPDTPGAPAPAARSACEVPGYVLTEPHKGHADWHGRRVWTPPLLAAAERHATDRLAKSLAEALSKYGGHLPDCKMRDGNTGPKGRPCTCGWGEDDDEGARRLGAAERPQDAPRSAERVRWEPGCSCPNDRPTGFDDGTLLRVSTCRVHGDVSRSAEPQPAETMYGGAYELHLSKNGDVIITTTHVDDVPCWTLEEARAVVERHASMVREAAQRSERARVLPNLEYVLDERYIIYGDDEHGWHWAASVPGWITLHPGKCTRDEAIATCRRHAGLPPLSILGTPIVKPAAGERGDMERELLRRIVKYAREDRAETPRATRLARVLAEAERHLAALPPKGSDSDDR